MRYFRFELDSPKVNIYPLVCWHVGAKQSSTRFIEKILDAVRNDPDAKAIYMGDGGECVIKNSKGNIYEQTMSPGDQLRTAAEYLDSIKDKLLFGIRGNHGNRIDKETGIGWDEMLCARVGVPYLGVSALGDIVLSASKTAKINASLYCHHGNSGSITPGGKMQAGHRPEQVVLCDIALTAHTHSCGECWPARHLRYTDARLRQIKDSTMRMYVCGSAYDSRSGYAEEKQYPFLLPQHIVITLEAKWAHGGQLVLNVSHSTIDGFDEGFVNEEELVKWKVAA